MTKPLTLKPPMSGPQHHAEAEWLLAWWHEVQADLHEWAGVTEGELLQALAAAQVHATLALAAASALAAGAPPHEWTGAAA